VAIEDRLYQSKRGGHNGPVFTACAKGVNRKCGIEDRRVVPHGHARRSAAGAGQQPRETPASNSQHRPQDRYSSNRELPSSGMSDDHRHEGGHHDHAAELRDVSRRRLILALALTASFLVVEVVAGIASGSLALLSDAGHMLTDAGALALALWAHALG